MTAYLADDGQHVARAFGAACTFHAFVLDRAGFMRYQGRFDDSRFADRVTSHDLRNALEDVLAHRVVRHSQTRPRRSSLRDSRGSRCKPPQRERVH